MKCLPVRFQIAIMIFVGCFISYMLRVDISIYMLDMVSSPKKANKTEIPYCVAQSGGNITTIKQEDNRGEGPPFGRLEKLVWPRDVGARIRGAYFWGYMIMNLFGGTLAELFGSRIVLGIGFALAAGLTAIFPFSAYIHWICVFIIRLIIGLSAGVVFPAMQTLITNWAPKKERGRFSLALLGGNLGSVITMPVIGFISSHSNWIVAAITCAFVSTIGTVLTFIIIRNNPDSHPYISEEEKEFLKEHLPALQKKKKLPPYLKIFINYHFLAFVCLQFGSVWGIYFLMTSQPMFMKEVLGFDQKANALLSGMPHLARLVCGIGFGFLGDFIKNKELLGTTAIRKIFVVASHLLPGFFLCAVGFVQCSVVAAVLMSTIALGMNGAATITTLVNCQDLSPNYSGTLFGIANAFGSATGGIAGEIVGALTKGKQDRALMEAWSYVFYIGGGVYIVTGMIFICFGTGKTQAFNELPEQPAETGAEAK